jgi:hypothetical protein
MALVAGIVYVATHWHQVWTDVKNWFMDAYHFIDSGLHAMPGWLLALVAPLAYIALHWRDIWATCKAVFGDVLSFMEKLPGRMLTIGKDIIGGLIHGIKSAVGGVVHVVTSVGHSILSGIKSVLGIFSPSREMTKVGHTLMAGATQGITAGSKQTIAAATGAAKAIIKAFGSLAKVKGDEATIKAVSALLKSLTTALTKLAQFGSKAVNFGTLVANFKALTGVIAKLVPTLQNMWTAFNEIGTGALKTTATGVGNLTKVFKGLSTLVSHMGAVVKGVATATFPAFAGAITSLASLLPTLYKPLQTLEMSMSVLGTGGVKHVSAGLSTLEGAFAAFTKVLVALGGVVKQVGTMTIPGDFRTLASAAQQIAAGLTSVWASMQAAATTHWTAIKTYVARVTATVIKPLQQLHKTASKVATELKGVWTKIHADITHKWTAILGFMKGMPAKLIAPFTPMVLEFMHLGTQIMQGLAFGIDAGKSAVVTAAVDAVGAAIAAAKAKAGVASPSKVAAEQIGVPIGQGIAAGITSTQGLINQAITGVLSGALVHPAAILAAHHAAATPMARLAQSIRAGTPGAVAEAANAAKKIAATLSGELGSTSTPRLLTQLRAQYAAAENAMKRLTALGHSTTPKARAGAAQSAEQLAAIMAHSLSGASKFPGGMMSHGTSSLATAAQLLAVQEAAAHAGAVTPMHPPSSRLSLATQARKVAGTSMTLGRLQYMAGYGVTGQTRTKKLLANYQEQLDALIKAHGGAAGKQTLHGTYIGYTTKMASLQEALQGARTSSSHPPITVTINNMVHGATTPQKTAAAVATATSTSADQLVKRLKAGSAW